MKKLLLTLGVMLSSLTMSAQLVFVDANGKELANGTTLTMDKAEMNDWDEMQVVLEGLSIKNTSSSALNFSMDAIVSEMPSGNFACCFGSVCLSATSTKTLNLKNLSLKGNASAPIINTEWVIEEQGKFGTTKVQFKLSTGAYVNVNFVYADPASVGSLLAGKKMAAIYDMTGKRVDKLQKGINLVRFTDGSVKKHIVK